MLPLKYLERGTLRLLATSHRNLAAVFRTFFLELLHINFFRSALPPLDFAKCASILNSEVTFLYLACGAHCKKCTAQGPSKCDSGSCFSGFMLDETHTCRGIYRIISHFCV